MHEQRLSIKFLVPLLLLAFCALALPARSDAAPVGPHKLIARSGSPFPAAR